MTTNAGIYMVGTPDGIVTISTNAGKRRSDAEKTRNARGISATVAISAPPEASADSEMIFIK